MTINPPMSTLSPVSTRNRVEMLAKRFGTGVGVAVGPGVAVGVGVGLAPACVTVKV